MLSNGKSMCHLAASNKTKETNIALQVRTFRAPKNACEVANLAFILLRKTAPPRRICFGAVVLHIHITSDLVEALIF